MSEEEEEYMGCEDCGSRLHTDPMTGELFCPYCRDEERKKERLKRIREELKRREEREKFRRGDEVG